MVGVAPSPKPTADFSYECMNMSNYEFTWSEFDATIRRTLIQGRYIYRLEGHRLHGTLGHVYTSIAFWTYPLAQDPW